MAVNSVTNVGPGARIVNAKVGETKDKDGKTAPVVQMVHFAPGETKDMEVLNVDDPVFKGMVNAGDLVVGAEGTKPPTPEEKAEREAADVAAKVEAAKKAGYDEGYAKGVEDGKAAKK